MNKKALIIISLAVIIALGLIFSSGGSGGGGDKSAVQNTEVKDGIQYVTIEAGGGYSPRVSRAQAGIPTRLVVKTDGAYDCSLALVIRDVNFQQILPPSGTTEIDLGTPAEGKKIRGTCSMGMYSFVVDFTS